MKVIDLIKNSKEPVFSFEILPPLKGNSIQKVYHIIDKLREFDPKYINITSHHSEIVYLPRPDGNLKKTTVRKRPGTVAIAAAIQNKYGIQAVPHIICKGFTKEETEYALLDLNFLGINNLLLLRGDSKPLDIAEKDNPNFVQGGLRVMSTMCPTLVVKDGEPIMAIGSPGSWCIPPALVQILSLTVWLVIRKSMKKLPIWNPTCST